MKLGDQVTALCQPVDKGTIFRAFKAPCGSPSPLSKFVPASPLKGKVAREANRQNFIDFERGFGIGICNKNTTFARKGKMLRMKAELDFCPWPNGERAINVRAMLEYSHGVGNVNTPVIPSFTNMTWERNTVLRYTLTNTSGSNGAITAFGFPASGTGSVRFELSQQFLGSPTDPCATPYIQLDSFFESFALPYDIMYGWPLHQIKRLECEHWAAGLIHFPGGPAAYVGANFSQGPIGLVMGLDWGLSSLVTWEPQV